MESMMKALASTVRMASAMSATIATRRKVGLALRAKLDETDSPSPRGTWEISDPGSRVTAILESDTWPDLEEILFLRDYLRSQSSKEDAIDRQRLIVDIIRTGLARIRFCMRDRSAELSLELVKWELLPYSFILDASV